MVHSFYDQNDFLLQGFQSGDTEFRHDTELDKNMVHFYFCTEGRTTFFFGPYYSRELSTGRAYFLYNPKKDIPFYFLMEPHSKMIFLTLSLGRIHELFLGDTLHFLKSKNIKDKFYDEREIPTSLAMVLNQLFTIVPDSAVRLLYYRGKILEILSLYFSDKKPGMESCPFLNDQEVIKKIKHAKEYLLSHQDAPLGLKALAKQVGLNEYQLKIGFKHIYGDTVFGFLRNRKLIQAQHLLDSGKHRVSDVAYLVGYTNPSHFITAFKKKFSVTPKKYIMRQNM